MRVLALLAVGLATATAAAAIIGACSSAPLTPHGGAHPQDEASAEPLHAGQPAARAQSSVTAGPAGAARGPGSPDSGSGPVDAGSDAPSAASAAIPSPQCSTPHVRIVGDWDGGVVFNNAMTSADAGSLDRAQGILDALAQQSVRLQCCFEPWGQANAGQQAEALVVFDLDPAGVAQSARFEADRTTGPLDFALPCVSDVVRHTAFPASPAGRQTTVEYPLRLVGSAE